MPQAIAELIHPSAVIGPEAMLAEDVRVGPYAIIEGPVSIGPGCVIEGHACLAGPMSMGSDNFVGHGAVLGKGPQSRGYRGEETGLKIGSGNTFREYSTVHRGTVDGGGMTVVGNNNLMMINSHLGHDSRVGDGCTLVNNALVAGHVRLDDGCILSGNSAVQQRVRVGRLALLGGLGSSTKDIPPFVIQQGYNCVSGLNLVGLRRSGMSTATISALKVAFRILFKEGRTQCAAIERVLADLAGVAEVAELVAFLGSSKLGVSTARGEDRGRLAYA